MQSRRKRKTLILSILVVGLFVIWTVVPIYMLISQSVKPESIMFADPPKLFYQPIFDHFVRVFVRNDILGSMINSVIVSVSTMVLCVVLGLYAPTPWHGSEFRAPSLLRCLLF